MEREKSYLPSKAELAFWRTEIDKAITRCVRIGQVDLVTLWAKPESIVLRIVQDSVGTSCHFLEAVPKTHITIWEIDEPDRPWEIIINAASLNLSEVAKELPTFMHLFYPKVKELPINIYQSRKDFRKGKPAMVSRFENGLVTVKTAS